MHCDRAKAALTFKTHFDIIAFVVVGARGVVGAERNNA